MMDGMETRRLKLPGPVDPAMMRRPVRDDCETGHRGEAPAERTTPPALDQHLDLAQLCDGVFPAGGPASAHPYSGADVGSGPAASASCALDALPPARFPRGRPWHALSKPCPERCNRYPDRRL